MGGRHGSAGLLGRTRESSTRVPDSWDWSDRLAPLPCPRATVVHAENRFPRLAECHEPLSGVWLPTRKGGPLDLHRGPAPLPWDLPGPSFRRQGDWDEYFGDYYICSVVCRPLNQNSGTPSDRLPYSRRRSRRELGSVVQLTNYECAGRGEGGRGPGSPLVAFARHRFDRRPGSLVAAAPPLQLDVPVLW